MKRTRHNTVHIDWEALSVSFLDERDREVVVYFDQDRSASAKVFRMIVAVAIAQSSTQRVDGASDWKGADVAFLDRVVAAVGADVSGYIVLSNYWGKLRHGPAAPGALVNRVVREGTELSAAHTKEVASSLFRRKDNSLFLGGRTPTDHGFHYWPVIFERFGTGFEDLESAVLGWLTERSADDVSVMSAEDRADARLKALLLKDAQRGLLERLHGRGIADYRRLRLHQDATAERAPSRADTAESDETHRLAAGQTRLNLDQMSVRHLGGPTSVSVDRLIAPDTHYIIRAPSGAGKSTLLRWIQLKINERTDCRAFFLRATQVPTCDPLSWRALARQLLLSFDRLEDNEDLLGHLRTLLDSGRLVLLIDALDNTGNGKRSSSMLLAALESILQPVGPSSAARDNVVIATSRLTGSEHWHRRRNTTVVEIQPFDDDALEVYFDTTLDKARQLVHWDLSLLQTPMLAYVVRTLLESTKRHGHAARIGTLWELYEAFVEHIFGNHLQDRQPPSDVDWADRVQRYLAALSYWALDLAEPAQRVIPVLSARRSVDTVGRPSHKRRQPHPSEYNLQLTDLSITGLVEIIPVAGQGRYKALCFVHQSFQEFLAATHVHHSDAHVRHLITQYWKPTWHAVLRFLVGVRGAAVVHDIYESSGCKDAICSRQLIAATCIGGQQVADIEHARLAQSLMDELASLFEHADRMVRLQVLLRPDGFVYDALWALIEIGSMSSVEACWRMVSHESKGWSIRIERLGEVIWDRLYTWQRFCVAREQVLKTATTSSGACHLCGRDDFWFQCMVQWVRWIPREEALSTLVEMLQYTCTGTRRREREQLIWALASRVRIDDIVPLVCKMAEVPRLGIGVAVCLNHEGGNRGPIGELIGQCHEQSMRQAMQVPWEWSCSELDALHKTCGHILECHVWDKWVEDCLQRTTRLGDEEIAHLRRCLARARSWVGHRWRTYIDGMLGHDRRMALRGLRCYPEQIDDDVIGRAEEMLYSGECVVEAMDVILAARRHCFRRVKAVVDKWLDDAGSVPGIHGAVIRESAAMLEPVCEIVDEDGVERCIRKVEEQKADIYIEVCASLVKRMNTQQRMRAAGACMSAAKSGSGSAASAVDRFLRVIGGYMSEGERAQLEALCRERDSVPQGSETRAVWRCIVAMCQAGAPTRQLLQYVYDGATTHCADVRADPDVYTCLKRGVGRVGPYCIEGRE